MFSVVSNVKIYPKIVKVPRRAEIVYAFGIAFSRRKPLESGRRCAWSGKKTQLRHRIASNHFLSSVNVENMNVNWGKTVYHPRLVSLVQRKLCEASR